jgi:hypothetical protein
MENPVNVGKYSRPKKPFLIFDFGLKLAARFVKLCITRCSLRFDNRCGLDCKLFLKYGAFIWTILTFSTFCEAQEITAPVKKCPDGNAQGYAPTCRDFAKQMESRKVFHQFASSSANAAFGMDSDGNAYIRTVVVLYSADGQQAEGVAQYEFNFRKIIFTYDDVENAYLITILCIGNEDECIKINTYDQQPPVTEKLTRLMTKKDRATIKAVRTNLEKLSKYFCPDFDACYDAANPPR